MNADDLKERWRTKPGSVSPAISSRWLNLDYLWRCYHGSQYDCLPQPFHKETSSQGEYVPLRDRRPSIRYRLPRIVVKKSVAMIFAGRNWPQISAEDQEFSDFLDELYEIFNFSTFCTRVATYGSIGTAVPMFAVDEASGIITLDVWNARDCLPIFAPNGQLKSVMLKYLTDTASLRAKGINPGDDEAAQKKWWYRRKLTSTEDIVYNPTEATDWEDFKARPNVEHSYVHNLGYVPALWVKNLPSERDDTIDGESTFECILDFVIAIDYQLSQTDRGLKYNSDPALLLKEPIQARDGEITSGGPAQRTTSKSIEVAEKGDAKLLEMQGGGQKVSLEFIEKLRNFALEVLRGSRKDPQRALSHAMSGVGMQILEDDLVSLATELRISYGKNFLIPFTVKLLLALLKFGLLPDFRDLDENKIRSIKLAWGPWFPPGTSDLMQLGQALEQMTRNCHLDLTTAREITYHYLGKVAPKNADYDFNLQLLAAINKAENLWQIEIALATAVSGAEQKIQGVKDKKAKQNARKNGTMDSSGTESEIADLENARSAAQAALDDIQIAQASPLQTEIDDDAQGADSPISIAMSRLYDVNAAFGRGGRGGRRRRAS